MHDGQAVKVLFEIHKAFDPNISVLAIFFDFAKAFDLVPHDLLLAQLVLFLLLWLVRCIAAYLSGGKQRVRMGEHITEWMNVEAGVIQGSLLGPVLFLLFFAGFDIYLPPGDEIKNTPMTSSAT